MINFVAASTKIIEYIDGCQITDYNEVIIIDYRGYLLDIQLEDYFRIKENMIDKLDTSKLNSHKLSSK